MSVLGAIATIAPSVINVASQMSTNKANSQMVNTTNQQNLAWQREVMRKNREQFLSDREYNSPSHLASMMEAAGFNRNLLTGMNPESAVMAPNSASASSVAGRNDAPQVDPSLVMNLLESKARIENINADTENKQADTENKEFENSPEQRQLRTRVLTATGQNMSALARQNLTKADVDEALKSLFIESEEYRMNSEIAQNRAKVADIFYDAIMKYGHKIATFDYRYQYSNNPQDLPAVYSKDGRDVVFETNCINYIAKQLNENNIKLSDLEVKSAERSERIDSANETMMMNNQIINLLFRITSLLMNGYSTFHPRSSGGITINTSGR